MVSKAIEVAATIDEQGQVQLDAALPVAGPRRARIIVLIPEETDIAEAEWLALASASPAFDALRGSQEDLYTWADGKPFRDQG